MGRREDYPAGGTCLDDPNLVGILSQVLQDRENYGRWDPSIRSSVAWILGETGDHSMAEHLLRALYDRSDSVRWAAAWSLRKIGDLEALENMVRNRRIDIYEPAILSTARSLAVRFFSEESPFIPVYPALVAKYKPRWRVRNTVDSWKSRLIQRRLRKHRMR